LALLAALLSYLVAGWLVRFLLTVLTLPLAGLLRTPRPLPTLRAIRLLGSAACGLGGFLAAVWVSERIGLHAPVFLGFVVVVASAAIQGWGLRRLAGGPQFREELFSLVGEELGVLAGVGLWFALRT